MYRRFPQSRFVFVALLLLTTAARAQTAPPSQLVQRGAYLTRAADCVACHTAPNGKTFGGGREFRLPQGTLYSPNITPDPQTGIGRWTDDDFVRALQKGIGRDGRHYYPAFPYPYYTRLSREDMLAIKAYLFSQQPVHYAPPQNDMHFPYSQRWLMIFWNLLYNPNERFKPDPQHTEEWNRGAYLTEVLGHCGACHTPLNVLQGPKMGRKFAGAVIQGWHAYNITADPQSGVGAWSDQALADYLSTGHAEGHGSASGSMAEAINYSLRFLTQQDIKAMVAYLRSVKPIRDEDSGPAPIRTAQANQPEQLLALQRKAASDDSLGARLFTGACIGCHALDGSGLETPYAALSGSRAVNDPRAINATQVILRGTSLSSATEIVFMPAFGSYSDRELAALVNFTTGWFGRTASLSADDVRKLRLLTP